MYIVDVLSVELRLVLKLEKEIVVKCCFFFFFFFFVFIVVVFFV